MDKYKCKKCELSYSTISNLNRHVKKVHRVHCRMKGCTAWFETEEEESAHDEKVHRTLECGVCGKRYFSQGFFERHVEGHAFDGLKLRCGIGRCGFVGKSDYALMEHKDLVHRKHVCDCGSGFSTRQGLYRHRKKKHPVMMKKKKKDKQKKKEKKLVDENGYLL